MPVTVRGTISSVPWPWPKVISLMPSSQRTHTPNRCLSHNSSLPSWIWIMFHTVIVHDQRLCHDLDPMTHISKVKVTLHTYPKPCPGYNSPLPCWILIIYHTNVSWPWLRVTSPLSRSQLTHGKNLFLGHYLSRVTWIGMTLQTIVVHELNQGLLLRGNINPVRTCLVRFW